MFPENVQYYLQDIATLAIPPNSLVWCNSVDCVDQLNKKFGFPILIATHEIIELVVVAANVSLDRREAKFNRIEVRQMWREE